MHFTYVCIDRKRTNVLYLLYSQYNNQVPLEKKRKIVNELSYTVHIAYFLDWTLYVYNVI